MEEQINKYLTNLMSEQERLSFEEELKTNSVLAEELELEKIIQGAVVDAGLMNWQAEIKSNFSEIKKTNRVKKIALFVVGAVVVGAVAGYLLSDSETDREVVLEVDAPILGVGSYNPSEGAKSTSVEKVLKSDHVILESFVAKKEVKAVDSVIEKTTVKVLIADTVQEVDAQVVAEDNEQLGQIEDSNAQEVKIEPVVVDPCESNAFEISVETNATCSGKDQGELVVTDQSLNSLNNVYKLESDYKEISWQSNSVFYDLSADEYQLSVKDDRGCVQQLETSFVIKEKACYVPEKGFNPQLESWEYQGDWEDEVTVLIYDRSQNVIIERQLSDIFEWDGRNDQGILVPVGQYLYIIKQTEKDTISGYVTVLY